MFGWLQELKEETKLEKVVVESFTMDHRTVKAPFVRRCGTMVTPKGDVVSKFDLRFTQPNVESMPTAAVHSIEHLMAGFIRESLDSVIDISPMGCRTGFYLTLVGEHSELEVTQALMTSLEKVLDATAVPACNPVQCGHYRDHSLFGAKEYAKEVLEKLRMKVLEGDRYEI